MRFVSGIVEAMPDDHCVEGLAAGRQLGKDMGEISA